MKQYVLTPKKMGIAPEDYPEEVREFAHINLIVSLEDAKKLFDLFTGEWNVFKNYLASSGNPKPTRFKEAQHFAVDIKKSDFALIQQFLKPAKYACVLCINDGDDPGPDDDKVSIMFLGSKADNTVTGFSVIEKWPGLFSDEPIATRAEKIIQKVLTPKVGNPNGNFRTAQGLVSSFSDVWTEVIGDIATPAPTRPQIKTQFHPLVFFLSMASVTSLLAPNVKSIVGVLGYDNTNPPLGAIKPFFVGMDDDKRPVTDVFFAEQSHFTFNEAAEVVTRYFTA